jgi:TonB family protein
MNPKMGLLFSVQWRKPKRMDSRFPERVEQFLSLISSIPRAMGRFSVVLLFGVLCLTFGGTANAVADANNKIFVFRGKIQAVDTAARTLTLQMDKQSYVFVITDQTKIVRNGKAPKFADLKQGQSAKVEMKIGAGGKGMAVSVTLGFDSRESSSSVRASQFQSLFVATTPDGKTISWPELSRLVVNTPVFPAMPATALGPFKPAVFLLSVRPDGTVSNVEMLNSTGYNHLDKRTAKWATEWRFRPNSVVQVRVAIQISNTRY